MKKQGASLRHQQVLMHEKEEMTESDHSKLEIWTRLSGMSRTTVSMYLKGLLLGFLYLQLQFLPL